MSRRLADSHGSALPGRNSLRSDPAVSELTWPPLRIAVPRRLRYSLRNRRERPRSPAGKTKLSCTKSSRSNSRRYSLGPATAIARRRRPGPCRHGPARPAFRRPRRARGRGEWPAATRTYLRDHGSGLSPFGRYCGLRPLRRIARLTLALLAGGRVLESNKAIFLGQL